MEAEGKMSNVKVQMPKGKMQIADDGFRTTSTKYTDTDHGHDHERQCQSSKVGIPGKDKKISPIGEERVFQSSHERKIMYGQARYLPAGDEGLLIEFGNEIH
ncbi:MAG: hypothetical protein ACE5I8_01240, partial [Thermodesulfobacteriota bacterium]